MPYRPHRVEPNYPGPEVVTSKSPAPPVVVESWCVMVTTMDRVRLDKFARASIASASINGKSRATLRSCACLFAKRLTEGVDVGA